MSSSKLSNLSWAELRDRARRIGRRWSSEESPTVQAETVTRIVDGERPPMSSETDEAVEVIVGGSDTEPVMEEEDTDGDMTKEQQLPVRPVTADDEQEHDEHKKEEVESSCWGDVSPTERKKEDMAMGGRFRLPETRAARVAQRSLPSSFADPGESSTEVALATSGGRTKKESGDNHSARKLFPFHELQQQRRGVGQREAVACPTVPRHGPALARLNWVWLDQVSGLRVEQQSGPEVEVVWAQQKPEYGPHTD
ncbi:unnamed protein product [Linum trigynum]|uniref:Uncharacterized protein n=1 Tax=Linum trigynum TaxID=586398 RepID=A0AAV2FGI0_9ROSI